LASVKQGMTLSSSGPAAHWQPALYGVSAKIALIGGHPVQASRLVEHAFMLLEHEENSSSLRDLHEVAYQIYRAQGDSAKALAHLEAYKKLDDKARALAASTNAALMSARFDFANQDLKITRLRAGQAERDAALARNQARYHSMLISGLAFISVLLALGFVSIRRSRNEVRHTNRELHGANVELEKAFAAKGEFLATTSHEIRTPLNGILGMTQVLLADRAVEPAVRSRVKLIHGAGETMRALVDDILDMAKMERGELRLHPAPMDLPRLLEEAAAVWAGQAETKGIRLEHDLHACPAAIVADEVRLRQIVFNLMSNAIKFTDRGQVRLSVAVEGTGEDEILALTVADSGIGIPPDRLAEIFESFRQVDGGVTRRHGGTGLGLAICRSLAHAMGGEVEVASVLGTGSTFTVRVPLERAESPAMAAAAPPEAAAALAEALLLLLEPNPLAQGILRAVLGAQVRALDVVADVDAAGERLAAGGVQHLLADAAAFGLDPAAFLRFRTAHAVAHVTLLWPSPGAEVQAALAVDPTVRLLAKPIGAPDLLAGLRMSYHGGPADRDIAA
jgi:signal transduction histidine kinase